MTGSLRVPMVWIGVPSKAIKVDQVLVKSLSSPIHSTISLKSKLTPALPSTQDAAHLRVNDL